MTTPDITIGEQVVNQSVAGNYATAKDLVDANWMDSLLQTVVATVTRALENYQATSVTSHNLDLGSPKTFALNSATGWLAGYPVRIMETSDPDGRFMDGHVQTNMTDANCTISITSVTGSPSGPYTSWRLLLMASATTPASSPGTLAEGCWGAAMDTATSRFSGRSNCDVGWVRFVRNFDETTPAVVDAAYSANDWGHIAQSGATGAFVGHEDELFQFVSAGSYIFYATSSYRSGDVIVEDGYGGGGPAYRRIWNDDSAAWDTLEPPAGASDSEVSITASMSVNDDTPRISTFRLINAITFTLADPADWGTNLPILTLYAGDSSGQTVNVAGGHNINGSASFTFSAKYDTKTLIVDPTGDEYVIIGSG